MAQSPQRAQPADRKPADDIADVCLIVEGAYPYVSGGVSSWVDGLIRRQPSLRFAVVAILPEPPEPLSKYPPPPNLIGLHQLYLNEFHDAPGRRAWRRFNPAGLYPAVDNFLRSGSLIELAHVTEQLAPLVKARQT